MGSEAEGGRSHIPGIGDPRLERGDPEGSCRQQDGAVRPTAHLLHLPGSVSDTKTSTMSALVLPRPLYGGFGRLCQKTGEVSRMQGGAQDSLQWYTGLPYQLHPAEIPRAPCGYYRRITRSKCRCSNVKMYSM